MYYTALHCDRASWRPTPGRPCSRVAANVLYRRCAWALASVWSHPQALQTADLCSYGPAESPDALRYASSYCKMLPSAVQLSSERKRWLRHSSHIAAGASARLRIGHAADHMLAWASACHAGSTRSTTTPAVGHRSVVGFGSLYWVTVPVHMAFGCLNKRSAEKR